MPRHCSVFGCKSNYDTETEKTSTFSLPKDINQRKIWLRNIPTDFSKLKNPVVCIKHFEEACVVRIDRITTLKGELIEHPRKIPKLTENAVPTIFPNTPSYFSKTKLKRLADIEEEQLYFKTAQPPVETPASEVAIKCESVSSEDSDLEQADTADGLQTHIEISETQFLEQPVASESKVFDQIPGPSETNISEMKRAEDTITSSSNCLRVTDVESALQKLEEICDKVVNITPEREDSFDHFGKYVASLLRAIPSHTAYQLQEQIIGLIMNTQINSK